MRIYLASVLLLILSSVSLGASYQLLPDIWAGKEPWELKLLPDGETLVGVAGGDIFRWTPAEGHVVVDSLPATINSKELQVSGMSADGSTVYGYLGEYSINPLNGFRWTAETGAIVMEAPPVAFSSPAVSAAYSAAIPTAVSADGSVIVGVAHVWEIPFTYRESAFRWTAETGSVLLELPGRPNALSADGTTITGSTRVAEGNSGGAYRWSEADGPLVLDPFLDTELTSSVGSLISEDGSVVVGYGLPPEDWVWSEAFRWTSDTGLGPLGVSVYGGFMSADGSVVVNIQRNIVYDVPPSTEDHWVPYPEYKEPIIWTESEGERKLQDVLTSSGVTDETWFGDHNADHRIFGVSADGLTIYGSSKQTAGEYYNDGPLIGTRNWIVHLAPVPEPSSGLLMTVGLLALNSLCSRKRMGTADPGAGRYV